MVATFFPLFKFLAGVWLKDLIDLTDELTPMKLFLLFTRWPLIFLLPRLRRLLHIIRFNFIHVSGFVSFNSISRPVKKASLVGLYSRCHFNFEIGLKTLVRGLVRTAINLKNR